MPKPPKPLPYVPFNPNPAQVAPAKIPKDEPDPQKTLANLAITHPQEHQILVTRLYEFAAGITDPKLTDQQKAERAWEKLNVWLAIKARARQAALNRSRLEYPAPTKRNPYPRPKALKYIEPGTLGRQGRVLNWELFVEREKATKVAWETHKRLVLEGKVGVDAIVLPDDEEQEKREGGETVIEGKPVEEESMLVDTSAVLERVWRNDAWKGKIEYDEDGVLICPKDPKKELLSCAFPGEVWHGKRFMKKLSGQEEHDAMAMWCDMQMNTLGL